MMEDSHLPALHRTLPIKFPMSRVLFLIALLVFPTIALAQPGTSALVSPEAARQVGLERMWFTQLSLDRSRGRLSGLAMHVSATQLHTVFQIMHEGHRFVFSERDRDAFHKEIGVEGAKAAAEEKAVSLKAATSGRGNVANAAQ